MKIMVRYNPFAIPDNHLYSTSFQPQDFHKSYVSMSIHTSFSKKIEQIQRVLEGDWIYMENEIGKPRRFGILDYLGFAIPYALQCLIWGMEWLTQKVPVLIVLFVLPCLALAITAGILDIVCRIVKPLVAFAIALVVASVIHPVTYAIHQHTLSQIDKLMDSELDSPNNIADTSNIGSVESFLNISKGKNIRLKEGNGIYNISLFGDRISTKEKTYTSKQELEDSPLFQKIMRIA